MHFGFFPKHALYDHRAMHDGGYFVANIVVVQFHFDLLVTLHYQFHLYTVTIITRGRKIGLWIAYLGSRARRGIMVRASASL
jgi:hypothetical protein